jgi:hypothetical protein
MIRTVSPLSYNTGSPYLVNTLMMEGTCRGFKVFYNRRYFLNFRRYLKN